MRAKVAVLRTILTLRSMFDAIHKRCLKAVIVGSREIRLFVNNQTGQFLANAFSHYSSFSEIDAKAFVHDYRTDMACKSLDDAKKFWAARERTIISVTRVDGSSGMRES